MTVNYDDTGICEVFANLGRAGGCPSQSEATSRLISTALRSGMDVESLIEQLRGIRCHSTLRQKATNPNIKVLSCPDAIGRVLEKVFKLKALDDEMLHEYECGHCAKEDKCEKREARTESDVERCDLHVRLGEDALCRSAGARWSTRRMCYLRACGTASAVIKE